MINVLYTRFETELPHEINGGYLQHLPIAMKEANAKFLRWQDRHANLIGKMLLAHGMGIYGIGINCLHQTKYNDFGKPFFPSYPDISFNISHSGEYVVCVLSKEAIVGIDIEQIKSVNTRDFTNVMTSTQWDEINRSENILRKFYHYWATKESVIKADGRGLSMGLKQLDILEDRVQVLQEHTSWYTYDLCIHNDYACVLALNKKVNREEIFLRDLNVTSLL